MNDVDAVISRKKAQERDREQRRDELLAELDRDPERVHAALDRALRDGDQETIAVFARALGADGGEE